MYKEVEWVNVVYKIVLRENGRYKTLFNGVNKSRYLTKHTWITAEKKMVKDGSKSKPYLSGFHCFKHRLHATKYLKKFRTKKDRVIVRCLANNNLRQKPTNSNVYLADKIKLIWGDAFPAL